MLESNRSQPARVRDRVSARLDALTSDARRRLSQRRNVGPLLVIGLIAVGLIAVGAAVLDFGNEQEPSKLSVYDDSERQAAFLAAPEPEDETGGVVANVASGAGEDALASAPDAALATFRRKIARTATIAMTVERVDQSLVFIRDAAAAAGGFVFSSSTYLQDDRAHGQIVVQVPFDRFDGVMSQLRQTPGLTAIDSEATTSEDVTAEFVDTESRIRNLQATEQGYLTLLERAAKIEDMLFVQSHLSQVRGEIEALQGRINHLDRISAYSTITVTVSPAVVSVAPAGEGNPILHAARESWGASLAILGGIAVGLVHILVFAWWLVLPAGVALMVVQRRRREVSAAMS